jgi:octaprenyl-diphosphate synthase
MAYSFNSDEVRYLEMLYLKTATLIEACAHSASIHAQKDALSHSIYGKNLGLSFQIIDDILDITSDEATLGKPAMNDFVEGKCTLPYIYLYQHLGEEDREKLSSLHAKALSRDESIWIREMMQQHKTIEKSFALAQKLSNEAMSVIKDDTELVEILQTMIKRSY